MVWTCLLSSLSLDTHTHTLKVKAPSTHYNQQFVFFDSSFFSVCYSFISFLISSICLHILLLLFENWECHSTRHHPHHPHCHFLFFRLRPPDLPLPHSPHKMPLPPTASMALTLISHGGEEVWLLPSQPSTCQNQNVRTTPKARPIYPSPIPKGSITWPQHHQYLRPPYPRLPSLLHPRTTIASVHPSSPSHTNTPLLRQSCARMQHG